MSATKARNVCEAAYNAIKGDPRTDNAIADLIGKHADTVRRYRKGKWPRPTAARHILTVLDANPPDRSKTSVRS